MQCTRCVYVHQRLRKPVHQDPLAHALMEITGIGVAYPDPLAGPKLCMNINFPRIYL